MSMGRWSARTLLEVIATATGLLGGIAGILAYIEAREIRRLTTRQAESVQQLESVRALDEAWDALGGEAGTVLIDFHSVSDPRRLELARRKVDQVLAVAPKNARALALRGFIASEQGDLQRALQEYDAALRVDPTFVLARHNRARVLRDLKRYDEALAECDVAIQQDPGFALLHNNRGNILADRARSRLAEAASAPSVERDRDLIEAVASYSRSLELNPRYGIVFCNMARALLDLRRPEDAEAAYRRALATDATLACARDGLARVRRASGKS